VGCTETRRSNCESQIVHNSRGTFNNSDRKQSNPKHGKEERKEIRGGHCGRDGVEEKRKCGVLRSSTVAAAILRSADVTAARGGDAPAVGVLGEKRAESDVGEKWGKLTSTTVHRGGYGWRYIKF
jgi:hypothetical protein